MEEDLVKAEEGTVKEPSGAVDDGERSLASIAHLVTFIGYMVPFGNIFGPLLIYVIKRESSEYVRYHAAEALNFQISLTIYLLISLVLVLVFVGFAFLIVLWVLDIVFTVIASIRASNGERYRYPMTIRFVRDQ